MPSCKIYCNFIFILTAIIAGFFDVYIGITRMASQRIIYQFDISSIQNNNTINLNYIIDFGDCKYYDSTNWSNYTELCNWLNTNYKIGDQKYTQSYKINNNNICNIIDSNIIICWFLIFGGICFLLHGTNCLRIAVDKAGKYDEKHLPGYCLLPS